jgi:dTDP-4-dehydrorhamnose reductase
VTGASGLVGAEIVGQLIQAGIDEVMAAYREHLPSDGTPTKLDLTQPRSIPAYVEKIRPSLIFHAAAITDVDFCERNPGLANLVNGEATGKIGEAAVELGSFVVYVSTDYVFDGKKGSYHEEDSPHPVNLYGESKLLGEKMLKDSGAEYSIARASVVYGWGRGHRPNFATWVLRQLRSKQPVNALEGHFASPTLNSNLASMLIEIAHKRLEGVIHLAGATRVDRYNFALRIAETFGLDQGLIRPVQPDSMGWTATRPQDSSLNVDKAMKHLESKPLQLNEALAQFKALQR